jgi:hypothetical protein
VNGNAFRKVCAALRAEWLSPKDFVRHAILISLAFGVVQACGLREYTSVLNGTTGSLGVSWQMAAALGMIYVLVYLGFVLVVPTLLLAAVISKGWRRLVGKSRAS